MPLDASTQITITNSAGQSFQVWDETRGEPQGQGVVREVMDRQFEGSYADRFLLCAWTDRINIALALFGGATTVSGKPVITLPATYPYNPNAWLVNRIEISGDGNQSYDASHNMIAFERAKMRVRYGAPEWGAPNASAIGEEELDFSSTAFSLPAGSVSFVFGDASPVPVETAPSLRLTTVMFSVSRYMIPDLPVATITSLVDHTNNATFLGQPAGQLLFRGGRSRRTLIPGGGPAASTGGGPQLIAPTSGPQLMYSVQYCFEYHPFGWNTAPQAGKNPLFQPIYVNNGGGGPPSVGPVFYTQSDFSPLLS